MTEKIYISSPGETLDTGEKTVLVAECDIVSKSRYTKKQLEEKRDALLDEAQNMDKIIKSME